MPDITVPHSSPLKGTFEHERHRPSPAYFNVHLRGPWPDVIHPGEFAIITPFATTGETGLGERNHEADFELKCRDWETRHKTHLEQPLYRETWPFRTPRSLRRRT
jgi:hypothetical protein